MQSSPPGGQSLPTALPRVEDKVPTAEGALIVGVAVHAPQAESDSCICHPEPEHCPVDCFEFRLEGFIGAVDVRNPNLFSHLSLSQK